MIYFKLLLLSFAAGLVSAQLTCTTDGPKAVFYQVTATEKQLITNGSTLNSDPDSTTYFVIHGWNEDSTHAEYLRIAQDLIEETQGNAILVDYKQLAARFYGTCAWSIVQQVGDVITAFIANETTAGTMHPSRIHIIGHSLGGQVSGYVGREVKAKTNLTIKRISALDPAGPLFSLVVVPIPYVSLSASDADVVDVLHTSILFGTVERIGTVDFYARGILGLPTLHIACYFNTNIFCNHWLSKTLFRESITSCAIVGSNILNSRDKVVYGFHMPLNATGTYEFSMNTKEPYGKGVKEC